MTSLEQVFPYLCLEKNKKILKITIKRKVGVPSINFKKSKAFE